MSEVLDMRVYSLLARMHETRDHGCRQLRESAAEQAQQVLAEARQRARRRVKEAVIEKRRRVDEHCRRVRVELESRQRDRRFSEIGECLAQGLSALPAALAARWTDPAARRRWCRHVLDGAALVLRQGRWDIRVAPGLDAAERRELGTVAGRLAGEAAQVREDDGLAAGVVVSHDGACYDGSTAGLTSNRNAVQAALLSELAAAGSAP